MKKLLLCMLSLVQAISMHAMGQGIGLEDKAVRPTGIVQRHECQFPSTAPIIESNLQQEPTQPVKTPETVTLPQPENTEPLTVDAKSTDTENGTTVISTASLRSSYSGYNSTNRMSYILLDEECPDIGFELIESTREQSPGSTTLEVTMAKEETDFECPVLYFGDDNAEKHIGLICVHGTWSSNKSMGADANRLFSDSLHRYAQNLAEKNEARVTMILPQWSGALSTKDRAEAAQNIDKKLFELHAKRPFNELNAVGHSHGCNVLLNLSLIGRGSSEFNTAALLKTMVLIAPPLIEFEQFYDYPKSCTIYAFHSRNDATQMSGSYWQHCTNIYTAAKNLLTGMSRDLPSAQKDTGTLYNLSVEYLPETGMPPHHKSIKSMSLIDCLDSVEQLVHKLYPQYYSLKLWITTGNGKYRPALALNDATVTTETNPDMMELAKEASNNVIEHLPRLMPNADKKTEYFLMNLLNEAVIYKDPTALK